MNGLDMLQNESGADVAAPIVAETARRTKIAFNTTIMMAGVAANSG